MNNSVRNEAQRVGILAIVVALVVLIVFFFLSKSGVGSSGTDAAAGVSTGSSTMQSGAAPSPAST